MLSGTIVSKKCQNENFGLMTRLCDHGEWKEVDETKCVKEKPEMMDSYVIKMKLNIDIELVLETENEYIELTNKLSETFKVLPSNIIVDDSKSEKKEMIIYIICTVEDFNRLEEEIKANVLEINYNGYIFTLEQNSIEYTTPSFTKNTLSSTTITVIIVVIIVIVLIAVALLIFIKRNNHVINYSYEAHGKKQRRKCKSRHLISPSIY